MHPVQHCRISLAEQLMVHYRHARCEQLPLGCGGHLPGHTANAVHPIIQKAQLAQLGRVHLNAGCHCHNDTLDSIGPFPGRLASGQLYHSRLA